MAIMTMTTLGLRSATELVCREIRCIKKLFLINLFASDNINNFEFDFPIGYGYRSSELGFNRIPNVE